MLKKIIFIILLTNMANNNVDKALPNESNSQIDWNFIDRLEGNLNYGHQPSENSGVTIGSGFDLKEKTVSSLESMGFDGDLIDKLEPYLGLTGDKAAKKIKEENLVLGADEISNINRLSKKHYTKDIKNQYEEGTGKKFWKLSPEQQTVIMSVGYQYGSFKGKGRPVNFWKKVRNDDWTGVVNELNNFGDKHSTRREKEAKYLFDSLDKE